MIFWRIQLIFFGVLIILNTSCQDDYQKVGQIDVFTYDSPIVDILNDTIFLRDKRKIHIRGINSGGHKHLVLINHVETDTIGLDPGLSTLGLRRADELTRLWSNTPIRDFYISHYRRTYLSILPLSKSIDAEIFRYEPGDQNLFAELLLRDEPGTAFIVGHNETLPTLLEFLTQGRRISFDFKDNDYIIIASILDDVVSSLHKLKYLP